MPENRSKDEAVLAAARHWRDVLRAERTGRAAPAPKPRKKTPHDNDYAAQITRAEFGRFYVDPKRTQQELRDGEIVLTDKRKPPRKEG